LPAKELGDDIAKVEGVAAVAPVVTQTDSGAGFSVVYGIDPMSFDRVSGGFTFLAGRMFEKPDEVLVDDRHAGNRKIAVGDSVTLLEKTFTVSGIVANGKGSRIFVPIRTLQQIQGREPREGAAAGFASMFYVKLRDRNDTTRGLERLREAFKEEGYQVIDVEEFASLLLEANSGIMNAVFNVIVFLGVSIGVLVIFLSMYTTVTERTREIGILRSMGASKGFIIALVLQESVLLCAVGVVTGLGASYAIAAILQSYIPELNILITPGWLLRAALFAVLSGLIGAFYPALKAASADPIEALAYE
jgi:putative ABC transport system permease protein